MDMDNELDDFERTGTPSLVGQSIRGEPRPNSSSRSRTSSKPNFKVSRSPEISTTSLAELQQEGVLLQDEDDLEDILDKEGHVKDAALDVSEQGSKDELKPPSSIDVQSINEQEEHDSFVANDQAFIAPASSRDGSKSRSSSARPGLYKQHSDNKPSRTSPLTNSSLNLVDDLLEEDTDLEPSIKDVVNDYNEGHYKFEADNTNPDIKEETEPQEEERQPRKITRSFEEPQIPDLLIDIDSENTVPAGAREGADSPYISSPSKSVTPNSNGENVQSPEKPHLAHGDSYQNTVTNNDFSNTPPLNIGERGSRAPHRNLPDSSLNYLRSISRSRSRVANDRKAIGEDRGTDENELKKEGALVGDHYDQLPDLEDAIEKALGLVEEEMSNLGFKHADIPEEAEEDDEVVPKDAEVPKEAKEDDKVAPNDLESISDKAVSSTIELPLQKTTHGASDLKEEKEEKVKSAETSEKEKDTELTVPDLTDEEIELASEAPENTEVLLVKPEEEESTEPISEAIENLGSKEDDDSIKLEDKEPKPEGKEILEDNVEDEQEERETPNLKNGVDGSVFVPKASNKMTYEDEPVYLYTSLAGGFHIATRTNRLVTILTANKVEYSLRDLGTDVEAKKVWRRYSGGKTLPGIVRGKDDFIGNWEDVEEANENYEVRTLIYETA